jgi:hypothetical protein
MLQPKFHIIANHYPVKSGATIKEGQLVALDANGEALPYDRSVATQMPVGLSGDTVGSLTAGQFSNRVSDMGNEAYASGKLTVYSGGGEFYVDINGGGSDATFAAGDVVTNGSVSINDRLAPASTAGQLVVNSSAVNTYASTAADRLIAIVTDNLLADGYKLPTGIPGEFTPTGDSDNVRKFAVIKLLL